MPVDLDSIKKTYFDIRFQVGRLQAQQFVQGLLKIEKGIIDYEVLEKILEVANRYPNGMSQEDLTLLEDKYIYFRDLTYEKYLNLERFTLGQAKIAHRRDYEKAKQYYSDLFDVQYFRFGGFSSNTINPNFTKTYLQLQQEGFVYFIEAAYQQKDIRTLEIFKSTYFRSLYINEDWIVKYYNDILLKLDLEPIEQ